MKTNEETCGSNHWHLELICEKGMQKQECAQS